MDGAGAGGPTTLSSRISGYSKSSKTRRFRTLADLRKMLPTGLPKSFHTGHLADRLDVRRHIAQRIAYCLRETGAIHPVGKQGNAVMYSRRRQAAA